MSGHINFVSILRRCTPSPQLPSSVTWKYASQTCRCVNRPRTSNSSFQACQWQPRLASTYASGTSARALNPKRIGKSGGGRAPQPSPASFSRASWKVHRKILVGFSLFFSAIVIYQVWTPPTLSADSDLGWDGKRVVVVKEETVGGDPEETVPSGTSHVGPLPKRIYLPVTKGADADPSSILAGNRKSEILEEYVLVGHGIRTVSFLSIQVYVVALYVATSSLPTLQAALLKGMEVPESATTATLVERESLKKTLLDDSLGREFFDNLLALSTPQSGSGMSSTGGVKMAFRIVPTRNTDFGHLRDGWIKGISSRTRLNPDIYDDEAFSSSIRDFKALLRAKRSLPKGGVLVLLRNESGELEMYVSNYKKKKEEDKTVALSGGVSSEIPSYGLTKLGPEIKDGRLSRALFLCYLSGPKPASEGARKSIVDGLIEAVERPVGSTSGRVV